MGDDMTQKEYTCTVSGMRPHKLPGNLDFFALAERLDGEIERSLSLGYTVFLSGMAMGADIWAAELVLRARDKTPGVRLVCVLPCRTQAAGWPDAWRARYESALAAANEVRCLQASYTQGCMQRRNRHMIDASSRLVAVHDGITPGGTAQTVGYARQKDLDVVVIDPLQYVKAPR
jgi:uncharacterized phage-like protein YoqJ